ncbi:flagellar hook assembly protein FlgD [Sphingomonas beigongshangi]|jgi:flagellar basal-body rod modification protein FlgD|uniref:flagellar hook assembly protein FlgD n=1 Tax=Sphingomonas beigongshangi TaxID=2782540 RepID=UPI001AEF1A36
MADITNTTSSTQPNYAAMGIATTASQTAPKVSSTGTKTTLDQSDFLALMTAQLKNQDPFNPVDNTQMVAQMAQFSSVAGISQMNSTLSGIATKLGGSSAADAMSYVGKTVLVPGTTAYPRSDGSLDGAVELDKDATQVTVSIADANGGTVRQLQLGATKAGSAEWSWDGKDEDGNAVTNGPFTVSVAAANANTDISSRSLVWAPVQSVSLPSSGTPTLKVVGVGDVKPADVRSAT